jgi:hypothetical protein
MPSEIGFSSSPFEATAADDQVDDYFSGHLGAGEDWQPDDIDEIDPRHRRIDTCNRTATIRAPQRERCRCLLRITDPGKGRPRVIQGHISVPGRPPRRLRNRCPVIGAL